MDEVYNTAHPTGWVRNGLSLGECAGRKPEVWIADVGSRGMVDSQWFMLNFGDGDCIGPC